MACSTIPMNGDGMGYWGLVNVFDAGNFEIRCPRVLELDDLELFDFLLDLCKRQVHRWSNAEAERKARVARLQATADELLNQLLTETNKP